MTRQVMHPSGVPANPIADAFGWTTPGSAMRIASYVQVSSELAHDFEHSMDAVNRTIARGTIRGMDHSLYTMLFREEWDYGSEGELALLERMPTRWDQPVPETCDECGRPLEDDWDC